VKAQLRTKQRNLKGKVCAKILAYWQYNYTTCLMLQLCPLLLTVVSYCMWLVWYYGPWLNV